MSPNQKVVQDATRSDKTAAGAVALAAMAIFALGGPLASAGTGVLSADVESETLEKLSIWVCIAEPLGVNDAVSSLVGESPCTLVEDTLDKVEEAVREAVRILSGEGDQVLLGILYQHCSYNGCGHPMNKFPVEARFYGEPPGCTAWEFAVPSFKKGWKGFNDEISSVDAGYSDCYHVVLWEHSNYGGRHYDCPEDCSDLGAVNFNDIASSVYFQKTKFDN